MSAFDEELQLVINKHNIDTSKLILVKEKDNYIESQEAVVKYDESKCKEN